MVTIKGEQTAAPFSQTSASPETTLDLSHLSTNELLSMWAASMEELRRRGLIRTGNNPTADYGEWLVADWLGLTLESNATPGFDATDRDGGRYQIKSRRLASSKASWQLGVLRNLGTDCFDYLVIVLFGPSFELLDLWKLPIDLVREHAVYRAHVNGHVLHAQGKVLDDPRAIRYDFE